MSHLEQLNHLKIPLEHIITATNNFSQQNFLGHGGFGRVYKGQLPPEPPGPGALGTTVAVKRLDVQLGQGNHEFLMEIVMLASYKHKNLVSLVGFVDEGKEKLLVYKNEDNGSLDKHLDSVNLTWEQRLKICLGAARGLKYLHSGVGTEHRVIHRDIKSSNILLDANWEAKISDFGLSKIGPRNQPYTFLVTLACGTPGYVDPLYAASGVLTKESDVYSFGVVLFEVLCGRLSIPGKYKDQESLLPDLVKDHYKKGILDKIIFPGLVEQMNAESLKLFAEIAFTCLQRNQKARPTIETVVEHLESTLHHQLGKQITEPEPQTGTRTKLWGSTTGGSPFLFQLQSNQKLRNITIYHDIFIHALTFTAEDSNGLLRFEQYGRVSNVQKSEINLDADEEVIGLSRSIGLYNGHELVTSLCFTTNKKKYGPFGYESDNRFSGSWDSGLFHGFYGRKGLYIDVVGCCLKAIDVTPKRRFDGFVSLICGCWKKE